jgi:tetratricopeptide (TPR) repeat protein
MGGSLIMNKIKTMLCLTEMRIIALAWNLPMLLLGVSAWAAVLLIGTAANGALADARQPLTAAIAQGRVIYTDEEEKKAYRAAKMEPDARKRAGQLYEFIRKYPKSPLIEPSDYESIRTIEEEYNAYYAARQESDLVKRAAKLIEFLQKYPESSLKDNTGLDYMKMLEESSQGKKYELLELLAEKWLKLHPNDRQTYAFIAEATMNLHKYERCAECLEAIYEMQPDASLAKEIHLNYQKAQNLPKQIEWAGRLFKMPEFAGDYALRFDYVMKYFKDNDYSKAAEYAQLTLKSADLVKQPDATSKEQLRKVRRVCYHVLATDLFVKEKYSEAISNFKKAIEIEKYEEGYYQIGQCLDSQKEIEAAMHYYAATELMGGEDASKAKARLELLYRALHNDTLVGIEKVYKKAKELLDEPVTKQDGADR